MSDSLYLRVVGVTYENRQAVVSKLREGETVYLVPDPNNEYDRNAVRVENSSHEMIGFISKEDNYIISSNILNKRGEYSATVFALTGIDYGYLGVRIHVEYREYLKQPDTKSNAVEKQQKKITHLELLTAACEDCSRRNGGCTDPKCGIKVLLTCDPNFGSDIQIGAEKDPLLDAFWAGYIAGHAAGGAPRIEQEKNADQFDLAISLLVDCMALVYSTMAKKMSRAGEMGDLSQNEAMRIVRPSRARDYYFEAHGILMAFNNICKKFGLKYEMTPFQIIQWFWDSDITPQELVNMSQVWHNEISKMIEE